MTRIGVLADTHIPDRRRSLQPQVHAIFQSAGVAAILHAGDVSTPSVLAQLAEIAPVYAVRGNRDWVALRHLPATCHLNIAGVEIGLTHGHGLPLNYVIDRMNYLVRGYRLELFEPRLLAAFPRARVIVFGHTHRPLNFWADGVLLFNPGSPHFPDRKDIAPSVGILHISSGGEVRGEICALQGD
ncbi:MAG: hypothetical protein A2W33_03200 [Chloroflexi bacterium RBG_16_52_11]|nr:MAG: hypothetical protein A2W33_03200 [Chloroflexi bacterium RBG_16_52_11]